MTSRWMTLLVMTRLLAGAVAVLLLLVHHVTDHDPLLILATSAYTAVSLGVLSIWPSLQFSPVAWIGDGVATLALVASSADWRSPFYVLMITALILPATGLPFRSAVGYGVAFTLAYFGIAAYTELDASTLRSTIRLETIATHLMVPVVVTLALAYAAEILERLRAERLRAERLAVESERQRIAWELHDSAKQRVHAAHLVLSALEGRVAGTLAELVAQALAELRAAGADMETSVDELRTPLNGRPVERLLLERARELATVSETTISVSGTLGEVPAQVAAHIYRIACEAMTNAVRHAEASRIDVVLARAPSALTIEVGDDGKGLAPVRRPGSNGLRSMRARAETIGAALTLGPGIGGRGLRVALIVPVIANRREPAP